YPVASRANGHSSALTGRSKSKAIVAAADEASRILAGRRPGRAPRNIRYTAVMIRALDAAIAKLAALPPEEQDRVGRWLLDELADDEQWTRKFEASPDTLKKLAAEARSDRAAGRTTDDDRDRL